MGRAGRAACGKKTGAVRPGRARLVRRVERLTAGIKRRAAEAEATTAQIEAIGKQIKTDRVRADVCLELRLSRELAAAERARLCLANTVVFERFYLERTMAALAVADSDPDSDSDPDPRPASV